MIFRVVVLPRSVEALEVFVQHKICMAVTLFWRKQITSIKLFSLFLHHHLSLRLSARQSLKI